MKKHFRRIVEDVKLTFEELNTVPAEIEACLNPRPLTEVREAEDVIVALTSAHFLLGHPVEALPDPPFSFQLIIILRHWNLCQALVCHIWQCWSTEYLCHVQKFAK